MASNILVDIPISLAGITNNARDITLGTIHATLPNEGWDVPFVPFSILNVLRWHIGYYRHGSSHEESAFSYDRITRVNGAGEHVWFGVGIVTAREWIG